MSIDLLAVMTIAEVVRESRLMCGTVRKLLESRELKLRKVGRPILIRRLDFEKFIDPNKPAPDLPSA
jgi:excisionase family DNA binding protein